MSGEGHDEICMLLKALQAAEEAGEKEFTCPFCSGRAWWERSAYNNHMHSGCKDCGFRMLE